MKIDWIGKLRHLLQVLAFCLALSAIQYAFNPEKAYEIPLIYSLFIGVSTWAIIDFGRHLFASSAATGWPLGPPGFALTVTGILGGYLLGMLASGAWFGWSPWGPGTTGTQLRNSLLVTLLAGIAASYYFYSIGRNSYLQRKMTEAHRHANEARLKLLETQLEPHMLFNTLSNLRVLIGTDPPAAQAMLDRMIAYLRATLAASRATTHPLQAEFDRLRDYLELMAVRMGPRLRYTLDLPPELASLPVPTLLLQPLVENSIKHGLEPKVQGGSITVRASCNGTTLTLEVMDTGIGPAGTTPNADGFGLAQVRERLATAYGDQSTVVLESPLDGGAKATITLPCPQ
jgi:signal transduction histidine kinase